MVNFAILDSQTKTGLVVMSFVIIYMLLTHTILTV